MNLQRTHRDFRLAFHRANIHTPAMVALLLLGMLAGGSAAPVDHVLVVKSQRRLSLLAQGKVVRSYQVALGGTPVGAKQQQGDHKTPEGHYVLDRRNAQSRFYKSIHVSYPNASDRKNAARRGVAPGGDIMIHGLPNGFGWLGASHHTSDWTDGCIAVTNAEMDEIWKLVADGTPIEIRP
jgi:murein L,D-transpeptidase YafK